MREVKEGAAPAMVGKRRKRGPNGSSNPLEIARDLVRRRHAVGTDQDLARLVGLSPSQVSRLLALTRVDPTLQRLVGCGELGLLSALEVDAMPPPTRQRAIAALERGGTVSAVLKRPSRSRGLRTGRKPTTRALRERFAERLRVARRRVGLTQFELSKAIGLAGGTVGMYETARAMPNYPTLLLIADRLGVSLDWLFCRDEKRHSVPG